MMPREVDRRDVLRGATALALTAAATAVQLPTPAAAATVRLLEGYADLTSVDPGGVIRFFVNNGQSKTTRTSATLTIQRVDYPSDVTVHTATVNVTGQTTPTDAAIAGCKWTQTLAFTVPTSWPSGVYQAIFTSGTGRGVIPFVVKPRVPAQTATILCQVPFTTMQAYNGWGGKSLYEFRSTDGVRSTQVSMDRPVTDVEWADLYQWVRPFIQYAKRRGLSVDYISSVDLHARPTVCDPYQLFVTCGHDEYWSLEMRQSLDRFVTSGGNAAILSGNSVYWQIRFAANAAGAANRIIVCHKDWASDPIADTSRKTVEWEEFGPRYKHALGAYSQHSSIGLGWERGGVWSGEATRPANPFVVHRPEHWAFAGTGVAAGARIAGEYVGYETDALDWTMRDGRPVPTGLDGAPSNFMILGIADLSSWSAAGERGGEAVMGMYRNNGTVFNAGTVDWCKGLTGPTSVVERITTNVIDRLATKKTAVQRSLRQMYQYHAVNADGGWRFVFSPSPFLTQPHTGWTYDGAQWWVYSNPVALDSVVPVSQYHAANPDGGWNVMYRLDGDPPPAGWTLDGTGFYAHSTPGAGRIAIYEHSAPTLGGVPRVVYSTAAELGLGWTMARIAFYAPEPPPTLNEA